MGKNETLWPGSAILADALVQKQEVAGKIAG